MMEIVKLGTLIEINAIVCDALVPVTLTGVGLSEIFFGVNIKFHVELAAKETQLLAS